MRVTAPYQEMVRKMLIQRNKPMSLREMTNNCSLTYHQVASCLIALINKGYVKRISMGIYQATEKALLLEQSIEAQNEFLMKRVEELEKLIESLMTSARIPLDALLRKNR